MVLVQKWPFFQVFFLVNIGQENVFYDILEQNKIEKQVNQALFSSLIHIIIHCTQLASKWLRAYS